MPELHLRDPGEQLSAKNPRTKTPPTSASISVPFFYAPSDDGTDENLLILLHGLGDTHVPFSKLGQSLKLPQTAVLALRAPEQVPFLYEESYQWYPSFDDLGEMLERPDPTGALDLLIDTLSYLVSKCNWAPNNIHLFGFAQGGSVAAESGIAWWKNQLENKRLEASPSYSESTSENNNTSAAKVTPLTSSALGSIVSISGPLLSYPTLSSLCPTPVLVISRQPPSEMALPANAMTSFKKAYQSVTEVKLSGNKNGMPGSREEWEPIMRFWSERLSRRQAEGLYEVMSSLVT